MAVLIRRHSRLSAPDMTLPPIIEVPVSTSTSPTSLKSFKGRDNENPFRRNSRRSSVSLSDSGSPPRGSPTTTAARRVSVSEKRASVDLSKSEKIMEKLEQRRRSSILKTAPNDRKLSFGSVGKRVTTILKAKNAFAMLRKRKQFEEETIEDDKAFEIDKLPRQPRFASTLSAEAQYAMMKGYEDVVYSSLCNQYPEYRPMLRRNRTPHTGVTVKDTSIKRTHNKTVDSPRASEEKEECEDALDGKNEDKADASDDSNPVSTSTPKTEEKPDTSPRASTSQSPDTKIDSPRDKSSREILTGSPHSRAKPVQKATKRLPQIQNKEKQLVMTYRYQRAMDILDNLRENQGLHALSPRVKQKKDCQIEPLKDYNSWSFVWTHEFEPKKISTNMAKI